MSKLTHALQNTLLKEEKGKLLADIYIIGVVFRIYKEFSKLGDKETAY